jgi:hypothetical protein
MADCLERVPVTSGHLAEQGRQIGAGRLASSGAAIWGKVTAACPHTGYS